LGRSHHPIFRRDGRSWLPLHLPLYHKDNFWSLGPFDAITVILESGSRPDEILVALEPDTIPLRAGNTDPVDFIDTSSMKI
jgi:hypothetical protein